jgi:uncharacterized protein (DUF1330 family)
VPKAYWIGSVEVHNEEGYKPYAAANPAIFRNYGGRFVVRGGKHQGVEGQNRSRNVVIEFPDYAAAVACYNSPEYQQNLKIRQANAITNLVIVEGYDGPQPTD